MAFVRYSIRFGLADYAKTSLPEPKLICYQGHTACWFIFMQSWCVTGKSCPPQWLINWLLQNYPFKHLLQITILFLRPHEQHVPFFQVLLSAGHVEQIDEIRS